MKLTLRAFAAVATLAFVSGCGFDLSLPDRPQRGKVTGSVDTGGHISAANLSVQLVSEDGAKAAQTTDAQGAFTFDDLIPGSYYVQLDLPGFAQFVRPGIKVKAGQTVELEPLAPTWLQNTSSEATLSGKVIVANNAGSVRGGQVEFLLQPVNERIAIQALADDGVFLQKLPPGTYSVKATHPAYVTQLQENVTLADGEKRDLSASPLVFQLNPATLLGTVTEEVDGLSAIPSNGATITLDNGANTTTLDGGYQVGGLAEGVRQVRVTKSGFHDLSSHVVQLTAGQTSVAPVIALDIDRGKIRGTVQTSDGTPVNDVTVSVSGTPYGAVVSPSSSNPAIGTFEISNVPVGSYAVSANKPRYSTAVKASVSVTYLGTTDVGLMNLVLLAGDFAIDDNDSNSQPGYVNTASVTLKLSNVAQATKYRASEDNTFAGVAFQSIPGTNIPFTLSSVEGLHTVYLQYQDANGTSSDVLSATAVLDTTAPGSPTVRINAGAAYTNVANPLTLTLTAVEGTSSAAVSGLSAIVVGESVDTQGNVVGAQQAYQRDIPFTRSSSSDGPATVFVQFIDRAGNVSSTAQATIIVDTQAPSGNITLQAGSLAQAGFTNSGTVFVNETWSPEPDGGSVLIRFANSAGALSSSPLVPTQAVSSWQLDTSTEGSKTVFAQLQDVAGNSSGQLSAAITYDHTPPNQATLSVVNGALTNSASISLNVGAVDTNGLAPLGLTISDDPTFSSSFTVGPRAMPGTGNSVPFTLPPGDGNKQLYARYRDVAGNDTVVSASVVLDTTPPSGSFTVSGTLADGSSSSSVTTTNALKVQLVQAGATKYLLGDGTLTTCPSNVALYTAIPQGLISYTTTSAANPRVVNLCLRDDAGNVTGPLTQTISFDNSAPTGCTLTVSGLRKSGGTSTVATYDPKITATVSGCLESPTDAVVTFGGAPNCTQGLTYGGFSQTVPLTISGTDGVYSVVACLRDAARNIVALGPKSITLDTLPPTINSVTVQGGSSTSASSVNIVVNATDSNGLLNSDALTVTENPTFSGTPIVGPQAFGANPTTVNLPLSAGDGAKTIYGRVRDAAGNETVMSGTVTRDTAPPSVVLQLVGQLADGTNSGSITTTAAVTGVLTTRDDAVAYSQVASGSSNCSSATYTNLPNGSSPQFPLTVTPAAGSQSAFVCFKDATGNVTASPVSASITYDATGPSGCTFSLQGFRTDGSNAAVGQTATSRIAAIVSGCSDVADVFIVNGSAGCGTGASVSWAPYVSGQSILQTLGGTEGANSVSGCVRDTAHRTVSVGPLSINLDTTEPSVFGINLNNGDPFINGSQRLSDGGTNAFVRALVSGASEWALAVDDGGFGAYQTYSSGSFVQVPVNGEGQHSVSALFRDALYNTTRQPSTASIVVDTIPPDADAGSVTILGQNGAGFVRSPYMTLQVKHPMAGGVVDAVSVRLAENLGVPPCDSNDMVSADDQALALNYAMSFSTADGVKTTCAQWVDSAGNVSAFARQASTKLDQTPPNPPVSVTADAIVGLNSDGGFTVNVINRPAVPDHRSWQILPLGADAGGWIDANGGDAGLLSFFFTLQPPLNNIPVDGRLNVLRVRETDLADNASDPAIVNVLYDTVRPAVPSVNQLWVDNSNEEGTLYWQQPNDAGTVSGYLVSYDSVPRGNGASRSYQGTFAGEGPSPISVTALPNTAVGQHVKLSGLGNGSQTYVGVQAVDPAGNTSGFSSEIVLQPNETSMNLLQSIQLFATAPAPVVPGNARIDAIAVQGDWAYAAAVPNNGCGYVVFQPIWFHEIDSPIQASGISPSIAPPLLMNPVVFADSSACGQTVQGLASEAVLQVDGRYLYLSAGTHFRIFELDDPSSPVLLADVDLSLAATPAVAIGAFEVKGYNAFISASTSTTNTVTYHLDLSRLYDSNSATVPRVADIKGLTTNGPTGFTAQTVPPSIVWTRDRLLTTSRYGTAQPALYEIYTSLDLDAGADLSNASKIVGTPIDFGHTRGNPIVSGNYLVSTDGSKLQLNDMYAGGGSSSIWTGTGPTFMASVNNTGTGAGEGQINFCGNQVFSNDQASFGFHVFDFSDTTFLRDTGLTRYAQTLGDKSFGMAVYGNYLLAGSETGKLRIMELATPSNLRPIAASGYAGPEIEVGPGLIYNANGNVFDLMDGPAPQLLTTTPPSTIAMCVYDGARVDDTYITAGFNSNGFLKIIPLDNQIDRDPNTIPSAGVQFNLPSQWHPTAVETWGNFLIVAEVRTGSGLFVEVYNTKNLHSGTPAAQRTLSAADKVGEWQFSTTGSLNTYVGLKMMQNGQAALPSSDGKIYFLDLRPMLDDNEFNPNLGFVPTMALMNQNPDPNNAAVTNNGAISALDLGGPQIPVGDVQDLAFRGSEIYVATPNGVYAFDGSDLFDTDPSSWPSSTPFVDMQFYDSSGAPVQQVTSMSIMGNYAVMTQMSPSVGYLFPTEGVSAWDLSDFVNPKQIGFFPMRKVQPSCGLPGDGTHYMRVNTKVVGTRAYISTEDFLQILELE